MSGKLIEIRFKGGRPEPIVVDAREKVPFFRGLRGGTAVVRNLRGDSRGSGKGPFLLRSRDVASFRPFTGALQA